MRRIVSGPATMTDLERADLEREFISVSRELQRSCIAVFGGSNLPRHADALFDIERLRIETVEDAWALRELHERLFARRDGDG